MAKQIISLLFCIPILVVATLARNAAFQYFLLLLNENITGTLSPNIEFHVRRQRRPVIKQ
jgi:hypothetical protein